jgi:hypothetical protein
MEILKIQVGEVFENDLPDEAFSIHILNGMPMIVFNFKLSKRDIQNFMYGDVTLGLFNADNVMFILFKISKFMEWSDLAFTIHLAGNETIEAHNSYLPINLVLVESGSKIVRALRVVTVTPAFRTKFATLISEQAKNKFDTIQYYKDIGNIYRMYPNATDMLKDAVIVETGGKTLPSV